MLALESIHIVSVSCGGAQSAAIADADTLYYWGWMGEQNIVPSPVLVPSVSGKNLEKVSLRMFGVSCCFVLLPTAATYVCACRVVCGIVLCYYG